MDVLNFIGGCVSLWAMVKLVDAIMTGLPIMARDLFLLYLNRRRGAVHRMPRYTGPGGAPRPGMCWSISTMKVWIRPSSALSTVVRRR